MTKNLTSLATRARKRYFASENGDVPGWVLVTIMTAGLVAVIWPFAEGYLQQILQAALDLVAP